MNHPASPGRMREVMPTEKCRNFKVVRWLPPRVKSPKRTPAPTTCEPDAKVRHIPLGHGLFATVDAADYKWLSQYKWHASDVHGRFYAVRHSDKGGIMYMHREIMHAPKGSVVDHIDHSILNNRQCNLHVCTQAQNMANAGPRGGVSGYVGVYRSGKRWMARIVWRGKCCHLGTFDSPIEAAKARDRKAYALHGPYAYLNFPEDLPDRRKASSKHNDRNKD